MMIAMSMVPVPRVSDCERERQVGCEVTNCTGKIDVRQGDQVFRNFLRSSHAGVSQQCLQVPIPNKCHAHAMERRPLAVLWAVPGFSMPRVISLHSHERKKKRHQRERGSLHSLTYCTDRWMPSYTTPRGVIMRSMRS